MLNEGPVREPDGDWTPLQVGSSVADRGWCGRSFEGGLLRFHDGRSGPLAGEQVQTAFGVDPAEAGWFAVDWLGRHFGAVIPEGDDGRNRQVILADVSTNVLTRLMSLGDFVTLVDNGDIARQLNADGFVGVLSALGASQLAFNECVSFVHPPFLGGSASVDNFEISDIDVYWTVVGQVLAQVRDQPEGTSVRTITVQGEQR